MAVASLTDLQPQNGVEVLLDYDLSTSELISFLLEYEAHKLGLEVERLTPIIALFRDETTETIMHRACAKGISHTAYNVTRDKSLTKLIFDSTGIANNRYVKLQPSQLDQALEFARACHFDVVIKPTHGVQGRGVFTRIQDEASFRSCWKGLEKILRRERRESVLVEERFVGADFRFFVVGRRVEAVLERQPANLMGDGISTISQLVAAKNDARRKNPDLRDRLMQIDEIVLANLRANGLTLESILPPGTKIILRDNANISTGGDGLDRTDEIPPKVKELVVSAVSAVPDLHTCGVDVLAKNIYDDTRLGPENIVFNELEGDAAMGMHHFPGHGKPRNLARAILLTQFPHRADQLGGDADYRHDFDENETLCRKIAAQIIALRTFRGVDSRRSVARSRDRSPFAPDSESGIGSLTVKDLAEITRGTWVNAPPDDWRARSICFHGRNKSWSLAIPNGVSFRHGVDLSGASSSVIQTSALLVDESFQEPSYLPQLRVHSVSKAVAAIARQVRKGYAGTICAVTGSVGKSSICTLLHLAIRRHGSCAKLETSYNTRDGVTAQSANLAGEQFAVVEIGFSALPYVGRTLRPHVAMLTAIAPAHLEYTGPLPTLAERKASIFAGLEPGGIAVINRSIPFYERVRDIARQHAQTLVTYGDHPEAEVRLVDYNLERQLVQASVHGEEIEYPLGLDGRHMAVNSLAVLATLHVLDLDWRRSALEFRYAQLLPGRGRRSQVKIRGQCALVVDDAHNANPASMSAAFDLLVQLRPSAGGSRIAVLADMLELGPEAPRFHAELAEPIVRAGIDRVYVAGELMTHLWNELPVHLRGRKVEAADKLLPILQNEITDGDVILFKGSRATNLSTVADALRDLSEFSVASTRSSIASTDTAAAATSAQTLVQGFLRWVRRTSSLRGWVFRGGAVPARSKRRSRRRRKSGYTLAFCGDTSLGDSYLSDLNYSGPYRRLCEAPLTFFEHVRPLIADSDSLILNLETCLVTGRTSPFEGKKKYLGWDNPERTLSALKEIGVEAVNLANNHTKDFGSDGLVETIARLKASGFSVFGAGETCNTASRPFMRHIRVAGQEKALFIVGAYEIRRRYKERYDYYATAMSAGVNPLSRPRVTARIEQLRTANPDALIIACPHWYRNYRWASSKEIELSSALIDAGADLVIGSGLHMLGQCHWSEQGTQVLSLGNFVFNSPGRYDQFSAPPFSLIARLDIRPEADGWSSALKLYPILTDNRRTCFQVQPADRVMLASAYSLLAEHATDVSAFRSHFEPAEDERGVHIKLNRPISPRFAYASEGAGTVLQY